MRNHTKPRTFILSAFKGDRPIELNELNHQALCAALAFRNTPFGEGKGCFEGEIERCVVVTGASNERLVQELCYRFNQDSYLAISEHDREVYLVDTETLYFTSLGGLVSSGTIRPDASAWTLVDGEYYTTDGNAGPNLPTGF